MRKAVVITALLLASVSCGDDETDPTPNPTDATITITAAGVNPKNVTINAGGRITWVNSDNVPHQPSSDPHPLHTDCPALSVNQLNAGQQAQTAALTTRRTCGFHDHLADTNTNLQGTVTVQ
jgi:plastocyanin